MWELGNLEVKTDIDIKKKLLNFEDNSPMFFQRKVNLGPNFLKQKPAEFQELLWILQQQPVYMSRLSETLRKNSVQELELDLRWMFFGWEQWLRPCSSGMSKMSQGVAENKGERWETEGLEVVYARYMQKYTQGVFKLHEAASFFQTPSGHGAPHLSADVQAHLPWPFRAS